MSLAVEDRHRIDVRCFWTSCETW